MAFEGRVALVSGAASGIGRAAALRLARAGARVVALDLDAEELRALADAQGGIEIHVLDVAIRAPAPNQAKLLTPEAVLDALERSLERGRLHCFPGRSARAAWLLRRLAPDFLWRQIHRIEGW